MDTLKSFLMESYCSIASENYFWAAISGVLLLSLILMGKKLVKIVSLFYFVIIVAIAMVFLIAVIGNHVNSTQTIHPILQAIILLTSAILTFLAFWIQFDFNEMQKNDISRDRFENNFYRNTGLLLQLEKDCMIPHVGFGKQAFHFMFYEYKAIMSQILKSDIVDWMSEGLEAFSFNISKKTKSKRGNKIIKKIDYKEYWRKVHQISFNIFISGVSTSAKTRLYKDCGVTKEQIDALNQYLIERQHVKKSPMYLDDYDCKDIRLYDGHRLRLVSFFRNVCMIVLYVIQDADKTYKKLKRPNKSFEETLKENRYLLYFLSLLSEHEISLLYIIYHYSTEEHDLFTSLDKKDIEIFFTKILPSFIMAPNMHPNDEKYHEFLNLNRINKERQSKHKLCFWK